MRLSPPALPEPSAQDVLRAQSGDRAAQLRVNTQRSRIRKRERKRERILAEQQDGVAGAEQSDARDGAAAVLDAGAQGGDTLCDDVQVGNKRLRAENEHLCAENQHLRAENQRLCAENQRLRMANPPISILSRMLIGILPRWFSTH